MIGDSHLTEEMFNCLQYVDIFFQKGFIDIEEFRKIKLEILNFYVEQNKKVDYDDDLPF